MLVISRNEQQTIVIDERITITVVLAKNGNARIGIDAPREMAIHRGEVAWVDDDRKSRASIDRTESD